MATCHIQCTWAVAVQLSEAAKTFGFTDLQRDQYLGGAVSAAFFIVGAPAALLVRTLTPRPALASSSATCASACMRCCSAAAVQVGYWMDRHDRVRLLVACVLLGEAPCLATVFVTRFWQLLLTRLLTGIAVGGAPPLAANRHVARFARDSLQRCCRCELHGAPRCAGAAPIIYGLLSDLFPPEERALVTTCVVLSQGAGTALGNAVAGGLPGLDWRMPFVIVSVPTLALATVMALTTRDPPRGGAEPALRESIAEGSFEYTESLSWAKFRALCKIRTNLLVVSQVRHARAPHLALHACTNAQRGLQHVW